MSDEVVAIDNETDSLVLDVSGKVSTDNENFSNRNESNESSMDITPPINDIDTPNLSFETPVSHNSTSNSDESAAGYVGWNLQLIF